MWRKVNRKTRKKYHYAETGTFMVKNDNNIDREVLIKQTDILG